MDNVGGMFVGLFCIPLVAELTDRAAYRWTMVHGHFLQMGGFLLCKTDQPVQTLKFKALQDLLSLGQLSLPSIMISSEEIMDRSKSDGVSKSLAVIQTLWFIAQTITRHRQHLAITQLELTTVALASLN